MKPKRTAPKLFAAAAALCVEALCAAAVLFLAACANVPPLQTERAERVSGPAADPAGPVQSERGGGTEGFSSRLRDLTRDAVFEVVIKKPEEKNIVYDKELDWSAVPYAIRIDGYYSIGTAFAISATEAVTAFHVMDLGTESDVFREYYIRDSRGTVHEAGTVVRASNEKDFVVFTVTGKTFSSWFELSAETETGRKVYSIGNALGEGIVIRNGLLLGTVPEEENGRWLLLKSSADGNPGNSGGPLVTEDGRAAALVIALRDNILYSLPAGEILQASASSTLFRRKFTYSHLLLANRRTEVFQTETPLPAAYQAVRKALCNAYRDYYPSAMERLFAGAPAYLDGPNNHFLLNQAVNSDFPELAFVDKNDSQWKISDLQVKNYSLKNDGSLAFAEVSDVSLVKLRRPKNIPAEKVNTDPKTAMDLILSGAAVERSLGGAEKYRILSLGEPEEKAEYRDKQGRLWIKAWWLRRYEDSVTLAYILPLPNGPAVVMTRQASGKRQVYEWDLQAVCDRAAVAYRGDMNEWGAFLSPRRYVPRILENFRFNWNEDGKSLTFASPQFRVEAGPAAFDLGAPSTLFLSPAYYRNGAAIEYGLRSAIVQRDAKGSAFFVVYRNVKPDAELGAKLLQNWTNLVEAKYPFDGAVRISAKDNTAAAGVILPQGEAGEDTRYSLYASAENSENEAGFARRFNALKAGVTVIR